MAKQRYLIALDLDGTVLTDNKKISTYTEKVIKQAIQDGHIVVIATGRPQRASIQYYQHLGLTTPMVNSNGGLINHPQDKGWKVIHNPLPQETALEVIEACYELKIQNILAEVQNQVFLDQPDEIIVNALQLSDGPSALVVGNLKKKLIADPTTLLIRPHDDQIDALAHELNAHVEFIGHRLWAEPFPVIEVMKKGIHKALGLQKIAKLFNIPRQRIIAFGDEDNDLEMVDYAGIGVAMDNGIPKLKSIANHITDSNENDGVAKFLNSFFQKQFTVG